MQRVCSQLASSCAHTYDACNVEIVCWRRVSILLSSCASSITVEMLHSGHVEGFVYTMYVRDQQVPCCLKTNTKNDTIIAVCKFTACAVRFSWRSLPSVAANAWLVLWATGVQGGWSGCGAGLVQGVARSLASSVAGLGL